MTPAGYNVPRSEVEAYIVEQAQARGVDPKIALEVFRREGAGAWQSTATTKQGTRENSWGPYQLYTDGGLGNKFQKDTGLDPRDPSTWKENVNYALDNAITGGWGPWYGAKAAGITGKMGIREGAKPLGWQAGPKTDLAGIFDTVADPTAPPDAPTEASSQSRQPMRMPSLLGGNEQQDMPSILSGMFNDPRKLAAMEILVKSLNPWSEVGNSMSTAAEARRRSDLVDSRDKRDYDLRVRDFDVRRSDKEADNVRADKALKQQGETDISRYLIGQGLEPGTPAYRDAYKIEWEKKNGGGTGDIKEYQYAVQNDGFKGSFEQWMQRKRSGAGEYGLTPIWGTKNGKPALVQPGKSGEAIETKLPEGFELSPGVEKIDLGTHWGLYDKRQGAMVGTIKKDIEGKEAAEERGKIQGQAQGELPAVEMTAKRTIEQIDQFMQSPGFNEVFGVVDQYRPNWTMSDKGRDSLARYKQLSGRAFLEGRMMLKGGGAITDFESNKAESAIARLERSQNETDAKAALEEFKDAVREGAAKLRAKAGGRVPEAPALSAPSGWSIKRLD